MKEIDTWNVKVNRKSKGGQWASFYPYFGFVSHLL